MSKGSYRPRRILKGRYYTWSELAPLIKGYLKSKELEGDEDATPSAKDYRTGNALNLLYGQAAHAFVEKITNMPCPRKRINARWRRFWHKWLLTKTKGVTIPPADLNTYLESGFARGRNDLGNYFELMKNKIIEPDKVEVLLENERIRGTGFHLTVKIDQIHQGIGAYILRDCLVDLKFDNCTANEFRSRALEDYRLQLTVYALVYADHLSRKKKPMLAPPVIVVMHVPTKTILKWTLTEDDLAETRLTLIKVEKSYRSTKEHEKMLALMRELIAYDGQLNLLDDAP
jgi:hypothetical protein